MEEERINPDTVRREREHGLTQREEEESGGKTAAAEVVLDVPATVGAAGPRIKYIVRTGCEEVFSGSALLSNQSAISF